jgi:hypothetical protein
MMDRTIRILEPMAYGTQNPFETPSKRCQEKLMGKQEKRR